MNMLLLRKPATWFGGLRTCAFAVALSAAAPLHAATFTGEFWNASSAFNNIGQAINFTQNNAVTATFQSTGIDYPNGGTNTTSSGTTLAAFLGPDAASIIGNGSATVETSVFRFSGFVDLLPGVQNFAVGSDDGYRLNINGSTVSQRNRPRGFATTSRNRNPGEGRATFELFFYENFGNTGVEFFIDGQIAQASPIPLPAGFPLILSALAGLGLFKWRRRAELALGKAA